MSINITATKKTLPFLLSCRRVASPLLRSRRHCTASDLARPSLSLRFADAYVIAAITRPHLPRAALAVLTA